MREVISLPSERHLQLQQIASAFGISFTETIGVFIRREILAGTIPDRLPGFVVDAHHGKIEFGFADGETMQLPGGAAVQLASTIERHAMKSAGGTLDLDGGGYSVVRVGAGVKITLPEGQSRVVSRDVARDVAGLIRRTIASKLREQAA